RGATLRWVGRVVPLMRIRDAIAVLSLAVAALVCSACGGGAPRSQSADLLAIHQPTPDPTLDAVVRDLPHALAGVAPTATPEPPKPVAPAVRQPPAPTPKLAAPTPKPAAPTTKPTPPKPTPTATRH